MNVCKWCMSGSATENSILLSVLPRLNKSFNQSINQSVQQVGNGLKPIKLIRALPNQAPFFFFFGGGGRHGKKMAKSPYFLSSHLPKTYQNLIVMLISVSYFLSWNSLTYSMCCSRVILTEQWHSMILYVLFATNDSNT